MIQVIPIPSRLDQVIPGIVHKSLVERIHKVAFTVLQIIVSVDIDHFVGGQIVFHSLDQRVEEIALPPDIQHVEYAKSEDARFAYVDEWERDVEWKHWRSIGNLAEKRETEEAEQNMVTPVYKHQADKRKVVVHSDTIIQPCTVMIKSGNTSMTRSAVLPSNRPSDHACEAEIGKCFSFLQRLQ